MQILLFVAALKQVDTAEYNPFELLKLILTRK